MIQSKISYSFLSDAVWITFQPLAQRPSTHRQPNDGCDDDQLNIVPWEKPNDTAYRTSQWFTNANFFCPADGVIEWKPKKSHASYNDSDNWERWFGKFSCKHSNDINRTWSQYFSYTYSFILRSALKEAIPNNPKHEITVAIAVDQYKLTIRTSTLLQDYFWQPSILLWRSSKTLSQLKSSPVISDATTAFPIVQKIFGGIVE